MNPSDTPALAPPLTPRARAAWRVVQTMVWVIGVAIFLALVFAPEIGIHAFWNVLIPVAPALFAIALGVWRNVCPLGSTALLARHVDHTARRRLSTTAHGWLSLVGVVLLLLIVPLRHAVLDTNGPATALSIGVLAVVAVLLGLRFEWKSAWCSGLCPVHPVERLYGSAPLVSAPNAHCTRCEQCVAPCPDATPGIHPLSADDTMLHRVAGTLLVGGFAGFIWGWFHVPDYAGVEGWRHLPGIYGVPLGGTAVSLLLFVLLRRVVPAGSRDRLIRAFAAAAIACYYWYRLPALFGFGVFPGDGMLVDLTTVLPVWFPTASRVATTALFAWWLVGRSRVRRAWCIRPPYAVPAVVGCG
ncbi:MAG: hypothetical protein ACE5E6_10340 [Phycisphaerae bacterium]